jgi:hypothetical protein
MPSSPCIPSPFRARNPPLDRRANLPKPGWRTTVVCWLMYPQEGPAAEWPVRWAA